MLILSSFVYKFLSKSEWLVMLIKRKLSLNDQTKKQHRENNENNKFAKFSIPISNFIESRDEEYEE